MLQNILKSRERIYFFLFLFFLVYLYYYNTFGSYNSNGDYYYGVLNDEQKLVQFYHSIGFDNSFDKYIFFYFLVFLFLGFGIGSFFSRSLIDMKYKSGDFYLLFFLYYFMQIFFQFLGINFIKFFYVEFISVPLYKFIIILSSTVLSPFIFLLLNWNKENFLHFLNNLFFILRFRWKEVWRILLFSFSCWLIIIFVGFHDQKSLLGIYVKYSRIFELIFSFVGIVILVPLVEELLFRKYLIDYLIIVFGLRGSIILSSIIFSLIHFTTFLQNILIFLVGIILARIYLDNKNILFSYLFHSFFNFLSFIYWVYID